MTPWIAGVSASKAPRRGSDEAGSFSILVTASGSTSEGIAAKLASKAPRLKARALDSGSGLAVHFGDFTYNCIASGQTSPRSIHRLQSGEACRLFF